MPNFWRTGAPRILKIQWFPLSILISGQKSCFLGPTIFKIPQPNWYYSTRIPLSSAIYREEKQMSSEIFQNFLSAKTVVNLILEEYSSEFCLEKQITSLIQGPRNIWHCTHQVLTEYPSFPLIIHLTYMIISLIFSEFETLSPPNFRTFRFPCWLTFWL